MFFLFVSCIETSVIIVFVYLCVLVAFNCFARGVHAPLFVETFRECPFCPRPTNRIVLGWKGALSTANLEEEEMGDSCRRAEENCHLFFLKEREGKEKRNIERQNGGVRALFVPRIQ